MRRTWRRVAAGAVLTGLALLAAWLFVMSSSRPELFASALEGLLGRRVELGDVRIKLGRTLGVVVKDLVIWDAQGEQPMLRVRRMRGEQRWPGVMTGQLVPLSWSLESPEVVIRAAPDAAQPAQAPLRLPFSDIDVHDGTIEWHRADGEVLRVRELEMSARRSSLRARLHGDAKGALERGAAPLARFSASFDGWLEDASAEIQFEDLELAQLETGSVPPFQGRARGRLGVDYNGGDFSVRVDTDVSGFRWELPDLHAPIQPAEFRLVGELERAGEQWSFRPERLQLDDFVASGQWVIEPGPDGRVRGELRVADFQPGRADRRLQLLRLLGLRFQSWRDFDARTEAGWMRNVRAHFDLPREGFAGSLGFDRRLTPTELRIAADVLDARYRPKPDAPPLDNISGQIRIDGNVLALHELRMSREGKPLPEMDIRVDGMHRLVRLPSDERSTPPGPGAGLPGLGPAFASIGRTRVPGRPEAVLVLRNARIGYPGFVLPLRDASAVLRFPDGNLSVSEGRAIYGGVPAGLSAFWDRARDTLELEVVYEDGEAEPATPEEGAPEQRWLDGDIQLGSLFLGDWRLDDVSGRVHGDGPRVELRQVSAKLAGGQLGSRGFVSLAEPGSAPFSFAIDLVGGEAPTLAGYLGTQDEAVTGTVDADGTVSGRLAPGLPFLAEADVAVHARLRRGTLGNTPRTLVLARLVSPMGWTGFFGQPLPFDRITADFRIAGGVLRTEHFALEGPQLGIAAAGEIDLVSPDNEANMLIALLYLESLGQVLKRVPVVGGFMPGKDESLVTLYVQLEGPWRDPSGRLLPPGAIQTATGWAGRLIGGGVRRLIGLVSPEPASLPLESNRNESKGQAH